MSIAPAVLAQRVHRRHLHDFAVPGATGTFPQGVNNAGHIVATYDGNNSFLYSNGIFTSVTDPLGVKGTLAEVSCSR
jgi:hypothetical protein